MYSDSRIVDGQGVAQDDCVDGSEAALMWSDVVLVSSEGFRHDLYLIVLQVDVLSPSSSYHRLVSTPLSLGSIRLAVHPVGFQPHLARCLFSRCPPNLVPFWFWLPVAAPGFQGLENPDKQEIEGLGQRRL